MFLFVPPPLLTFPYPSPGVVAAAPPQSGNFAAQSLNWRNPGFDLGYDAKVGPGKGKPTSPVFRWTSIPANFTASRPGGWGASDFGMNSIAAVGNFPTAPIGTIRLWHASWVEVQPQRQRWEFAAADAELAAARQRGVKVLFVFQGTPDWAASDPQASRQPYAQHPSPPKDLRDWAEYVRRVATRYKGQVYAYELWNEPTSALYWAGSPADLAKLTEVAYREIKRIDPQAIVVSPCGSAIRDKYRDYVQWYDQYLQAGGKKSWDVMSWHLSPGGPHPEAQLLREVGEIRRLMAKHGLSQRELWLTESTWLKAGNAPHVEEGTVGAAYIARLLPVSALAGVDALYYYSWDYAHDVTLRIGDRKGDTSIAKAWAQTKAWLLNAQYVAQAVTADQTWVIRLRRNGADAYLIWNADRSYRLTIPPSWRVRQVADLNGTVQSLTADAVVGIGPLPRLLF
jgi:Glycosyl hydrolase family 10